MQKTQELPPAATSFWSCMETYASMTTEKGHKELQIKQADHISQYLCKLSITWPVPWRNPPSVIGHHKLLLLRTALPAQLYCLGTLALLATSTVYLCCCGLNTAGYQAPHSHSLTPLSLPRCEGKGEWKVKWRVEISSIYLHHTKREKRGLGPTTAPHPP